MNDEEPTTLYARLKKLVPYALHLAMVAAVAVYVLAGALTIRRIEATYKNNIVQSTEVSRTRRDAASETFTKLSTQGIRDCVMEALRYINNLTKCESSAINNSQILGFLDRCYKLDTPRRSLWRNRPKRETSAEEVVSVEASGNLTETDWVQWSYTDAILFCFTVITTIGYGNVAPQTTLGRIFVIAYGLIGIPFSMLAIANMGKFLAEMLKHWTKPIIGMCRKLHRRRKRGFTKNQKEKEALVSVNNNGKTTQKADDTNDDETEVPTDEKEVETWGEAMTLFISFVVYILIGSMIIATYEPEMDFFGAIYFNFVSLTTVGLGDLVPKNETYLLFTLIYCAVGLALTTIAIEIAADYLKKLHYFGRKIDNVANVQIWFGGKKLTMKQLVKNLGDQFNLPVNEITELNLDHFVDAAIKVEAGELPTLRQPSPEPVLRPIFLDSASVVYVDEEELLQVPSGRSFYYGQ